MKKEMQAYKEYLETRGTELSKTAEFLPYYALPYVSNPLEHLSYKHLFKKDWVDDLRS
jgi:hypothetical protein